ncbi:Uncharacterised protein [Mycobacteroides abscessus]|nr:Uncharacterised protein [Mycobacteroides abscessus]
MSEIIGPAGREVQTLPPTVDVFQILNDATKLSQHGRTRSSARHRSRTGAACALSSNAHSSATVHVAAISRPSSVTVSAGHPALVRSSRRRSVSLP